MSGNQEAKVKTLRSRLLVFDGPDMTGKTNIAQELCRRTGLQYFKNRNERLKFLDGADYFMNCLKYGVPYQLALLEQCACDVVFDRHYPTEWVYSRAFNRDTCHATLREVDRRFSELDAAIVICHRTDYTGIEDDVFPTKLDSTMLQRLDDLYQEFVEWSTCECLVLNVDDRNTDREIEEVTAFTTRVWGL